MTARRILVLLLGCTLATVCLADEPAPPEGQRLYEYYCRSCHGAEGRGDHPNAAVPRTKPANLTLLAKRNDGEFPAKRVTSIIDGRDPPPTHGKEMPIWGLGFQDPSSDSNQEAEVRQRIDRLVEYLRTLQR